MSFSRKMMAAAGLIFLFLVPCFVGNKPYFLHVLIVAMFNIVMAGSLNFIMRTGQVPLCQSAFVGIGAYTSTLLVMKLKVSFWLALPSAAITAGIVGFLIGLPTLRIKGIHFAMATFGFGEITRLIFIGWTGFFGGANGIAAIPAPDAIVIPFLAKIEFVSKASYYYLALVFMLLSLMVLYNLTHSGIGRNCRAIEESELLSECIGIHTMKYKIMAFTIASIFAGMVGALDAHYMHFIGPQQFGFWNSVEYIIFVIIGGVGTFVGPILGAIFLTFLPEFLRVAETWQVVIYGMALMFTILLMPRGFRGFFGEYLIPRLSFFQRTFQK